MAQIKYIDAAALKRALVKFLEGADARFLGIDANAVSASKLQVAVKINGIDFDGSQNIDIKADNIEDFEAKVAELLGDAETTHVHDNKGVLDGITQEMLDEFAAKIGVNDVELLLYTNANMSEVKDVKGALDTIVVNVVALTNRVKALEDKDVEIAGQIEAIEGEIDGIDEEIVQIKAKNEEQDGRIQVLEGQVGHEASEGVEATGLFKKIEEVEAKADQAQGEVDAVEGRVGALEAKDEEIDGALERIEGKADQAQNEVDALEGVVEQVKADFAAGDAQALQDAKNYADEKIAALVDSAPDAMNTLNELANAINDHQDVYDAYVAEVSGELAKKVDKVEGKSLIDDTEIARLKNVDNYDDTEVRGLISTLEGKHDQAVADINAEVANKVDKEEGKSLIADSEIERLATLKNYDDSEVRGLIDACEAKDVEQDGRLDAIEQKDVAQDGRLDAIEAELPNKAVKSEVEAALALKANTADFVALTETEVDTIVGEVFGA